MNNEPPVRLKEVVRYFLSEPWLWVPPLLILVVAPVGVKLFKLMATG